MPDLERLIRFVREAPAGTMVPVESLREFLADASAAPEEVERRLTPAEAAEWLHRHLGGRKRSAAAVRKAMRTGFRGVVLNSYPYGRERRTTESDLRRFVAQIGMSPRPPAPEQIAAHMQPSESRRKSHDDPAEEITAAQERFGLRQAAGAGRAPRQRRAPGKA